MTVVLGDLISRVREVTHDTVSGDYRAGDFAVLRFLKDGVVHLHKVRPESRYIDDKLTDITFPTTEEDLKVFSVDVDERWELGIVYYAAARCFEMDVTDSVSLQLKAEYLQRADAEFLQ